MAHVELPQEELQPIIDSMQRVFEPFIAAIPSIIRIPDEVQRLTDSIVKDINSGQGDRFGDGSKKSVDMIQMMKDFNEKNSPEAKKRAEELAKLERIAQERQKAEADLQQLQQLGTPAEITEDNKVKILNEKEIIEKQKEYIKEQKEVSFLENQIAEEKDKGEDANSERLLMLKEALDKQNELVSEQGKILGDRLPRQKVKETVGAKDFIPAPLMEAYDNIAESAKESGRALGSIFQPLIGLKKLFTKKKEYEEDDLDNREKKSKKLDFSIVLTTLKFIALTAAIVAFIKTVYDLAKKFGVDLDNPNLSRKRGWLLQENDEEYKQRLIDEENLSYEDAGKRVRGDYGSLNKLFGMGMHDDPEQELAEDINTDFQNTRRKQMITDRKNFKIEKNDNFMDKRRNQMIADRDRDKFLKQPTVDDSENKNKNSQVAIGNVDNSTKNTIVTTDTPIKGDTPFQINVIGSDYD